MIDRRILIVIVLVELRELFVPSPPRFVVKDFNLVDGLAPLPVALGFRMDGREDIWA